MFGSSGSSSRCASFQWAGDLPVGNASSMSFGKSCRQVCCMFRGWTRWTQLAMDPKYLVCILCLTMDTVTPIPDVIYDSWLETILLPNFWLYIYICICIWSVWKHFELIKFINADAYNPQEGGGLQLTSSFVNWSLRWLLWETAEVRAEKFADQQAPLGSTFRTFCQCWLLVTRKDLMDSFFKALVDTGGAGGKSFDFVFKV